MTLPVGQRVKHRATAELGVVQSELAYGARLRYRVAFPSGTVEMPYGDLLPIYDDPFALLEDPPTVSPFRGWLRREAQRLMDAYRNDPTAALSSSRIEPQHHQISVALRALEKPQARLILADEVGLGKTIEAGLILKELRARGVLNRVLIITPASLVVQWQTELRTKFNEGFSSYEGMTLRDLRERHPNENVWGLRDPANVICSLDLARRETERAEIAAADWDLVIVDEAHHARRHWADGKRDATLGYQLLEELRDRVGGLLLLTATPMQLHDFELYSMVELVEPGLFEDYDDFVRGRGQIAEINKHIAWLRVADVTTERKDELHRLLARWNAPGTVVSADVAQPEGRAIVTGWLESKHLLSQAMVRNRKAEVGGFTKRRAHRVPVDPSGEELELASDVHAYIRSKYATSPAIGLVLVTYEKLIASSSRAVARALDRRAARLRKEADADDTLSDDGDLSAELMRLIEEETLDRDAELVELEALAARAHAIQDTKLAALDAELKALFEEQPDQKVLIFSQYHGTIEMLEERLRSHLRVAVFHGELSRAEKEKAYGHFKHPDGAQVMLSSEAGGEGRNFQFSHILFNYDLPWNPMRVEQRIGRLDRVGQKRNVLIYNFEVRGTLDARILDVLEHRIEIFKDSVGALEPILGDIEENIKRICVQDAATASKEFDRYELEIAEKVRRARQREHELHDFVMDTKSFRRDEVNRLLDKKPWATPGDLERFVISALEVYGPQGARRFEQHDGGTVTIRVPGVVQHVDRRVEDSYLGTFDPARALADETIEFFAIGHPLVDALLQLTSQEGEVPPVTVLEGTAGGGGHLVDYEMRLQGVRAMTSLFSHAIGGGEIVSCPLDPRGEVSPTRLSHGQRLELERASRDLAAEELERRVKEFRRENEGMYEAERARLEKRFDFQQRYFERRIVQLREQIKDLELYGSADQKTILPALRGQIERNDERLGDVEGSRQQELARLAERREPTEGLVVLGVTEIVPPGEFERAAVEPKEIIIV